MLVVEFPSKPISSWLRKITQNDDASTNLDDAVLDMPHRYQLLVNPAGIHPSQRFKTSSCTFPNDVAAPITTSSCTKATPAAGFYMQNSTRHASLARGSFQLCAPTTNHQQQRESSATTGIQNSTRRKLQ
ncbi:1-aminocyclopropane-1-carboxylate oxidase [Dorcoceras hygrometricum]|uniref:1-aminocyclopropane-1-carboxylate oxidase n=1 Tax=Dorcoceras hygrometricum TaxID=472368 RepID=A0A2Z7BF70_9LAMI|nr:1-aminocyclopropane-1-carboxylate oxidase [Dorcoceras hygrometricum]